MKLNVFPALVERIRDIFGPGTGYYLNEHGQLVYGPLARPKLESPISVVRRPTAINYLYFIVGWFAWTMDGYDFHSVSLSLSRLATYYDKPRESIATSITLTLLFRPIGAVAFGLAGDLYGRKYPMIGNLVLIAVLQLVTVYCTTFRDFLIVRALFGVGMGGVWGNAASMGLENMPVECRGLFSGILQQGYALGYLIAAVMNMFIVPKVKMSFHALFYIGAGLTLLVAIARLCFPESKQFLEKKRLMKEHPELRLTGSEKIRQFKGEIKKMLRTHWRLCIYATILMGIFNSMSHVSQDLYPTYMQQTKLFSAEKSSLATIIAKCGAIVGGAFTGYYSQFFGRRAAIIVTAIVGACFIPLWVVPDGWGALVVGAVIVQFCVQGAWGIIPIHLNELSPPGFRSSFPGITYQLGNMIASPMAQIASVISEGWTIQVWLSGEDGEEGEWEERPGYGRTIALMMGVIFFLTIVWTTIGDERRGVEFDVPEEGEAMEKGEQGQETVIVVPVESADGSMNKADAAAIEMREKK